MSSAKRNLLSLAVQRQIFSDIARSHGLNPLIPDSWYTLRGDQVSHIKDVKEILHAYKHNFAHAVLRIFPNIGLDKDKLTEINSATTVPLQEKRKLIKGLAQQLGYSTSYEDLYKLSSQQFRQNGLRHLISPYNDSSVRLITSLFPEHKWHDWLFDHPPSNLWSDTQTHAQYIDWVGKQLGVAALEDWYLVRTQDLRHYKGRALLTNHYADSVAALLRTVYPEHAWEPWLFRDGVTADYWKCSENCRRYLEWLGKKLKYKSQEDWYKISAKIIEDNHGKGFLEKFNGNVAQAVMDTFRDLAWDTQRLRASARVPDYDAQEDVRSVLEKVVANVNLQMMEEWYVVNRSDMFSVPGGKRLYKHYGRDMLKILQTGYPDHAWDASKFYRNAKNKRQFLLEVLVRELFVGQTLITNARKDTQMNFESGNQSYMELDLYLPDLQLAFEYQDPHHYFSVWYANKPLDTYQKRDEMKAEAAKAKGITLINIPFWWDGTKESLIGTIKKERVELLPQFTSSTYPSIPTDAPDLSTASMLKDYHVPGLGVPMLASPLLTLEDFDAKKLVDD